MVIASNIIELQWMCPNDTFLMMATNKRRKIYSSHYIFNYERTGQFRFYRHFRLSKSESINKKICLMQIYLYLLTTQFLLLLIWCLSCCTILISNITLWIIQIFLLIKSLLASSCIFLDACISTRSGNKHFTVLSGSISFFQVV